MSVCAIYFNGGVETLEFFSAKIAEELENLGIEPYFVDINTISFERRQLEHFIESHASDKIIAITFNFTGISGEEGIYAGSSGDGEEGIYAGSSNDDKEPLSGNKADSSNADNVSGANASDLGNINSIWDIYGIKVLNIVVDHPFYYHKHLQFRPKDYMQFCIDYDHLDYMRRYFEDVDCEFLPLAGSRACDFEKVTGQSNPYFDFNHRDKDIIFTGNYTRPDMLDRHLGNMDAESKDFFKSIVNLMIDDTSLIATKALEIRLEQEGMQVSDKGFLNICPNLSYADLYVRFYFRGLAIKTLVDNGFKVDTYGASYNYLNLKKRDKLIEHGNVFSQDCLDALAKSKLSLNVMPWFKRGAHDRVFNSMLNGALVLTDPSSYLEEIYEDKKDLAFYDLKSMEDLLVSADRFLSDRNYFEEVQERAYRKTLESHTWKNRALRMLRLAGLTY